MMSHAFYINFLYFIIITTEGRTFHHQKSNQLSIDFYSRSTLHGIHSVAPTSQTIDLTAAPTLQLRLLT